MADFNNLVFGSVEQDVTYDDETIPAKNHSTQLATITELEYAKIVFRDPRNTTAAETRMRYKVTKAPGSNSTNSRSRSFDEYSGREVNLNFAAKYHTASTQSGLNSHTRYLGMSESL